MSTNEEFLRKEMLNEALKLYGTPYIHGMHGYVGKGYVPSDTFSFDCAGLIWYLYHEILGIDIYEEGYGKSTTTMTYTSKHGKLTIYEDGLKEIDFSLIKPCDILLFHTQSNDDKEPKEDNKYPGHCGLYIGDKEYLHASRKIGYVTIDNLENKKNIKKLVGVKDIIGGYYEHK